MFHHAAWAVCSCGTGPRSARIAETKSTRRFEWSPCIVKQPNFIYFFSTEGLLRVEGDQPDALPAVRGERPDGLQAGDAARGADRSALSRPGNDIKYLKIPKLD